MSLDIIEKISSRCEFLSGECIIEDLFLDTENNRLLMTMRNRRVLAVSNEASYCCEHRYMSCDDLSHFSGAVLTSIETREVMQDDEDGYGNHDLAFLIVTRSLGTFTCCSHNEHNGYYGGFELCAKWLEPVQP
jgi:hypothetical protein